MKGLHNKAATFVLLALSACGGAGSEVASIPIVSQPTPSPAPTATPTPTPTPTPPPPENIRVAATIFPEALYNPKLEVVGKGWQAIAYSTQEGS